MKLVLFIASSVVILSIAKCRQVSLEGVTEFPYQVSLVQFNGNYVCSAAIISPITVLTAASCTIGFKAQNLTITHGSTLANNGTIHQVKEIIQTDPPYNKTTLENNISILRITPPILFSNDIQPIKLLTSLEDLVEGSEVIISGWGNRNESEPNSLDFGTRSLQDMTLNIIDFDKCRDIYKTEFDVNIDERMICADPVDRVTCIGDEGKPLIDSKTGQLVGVLSFSYGSPNNNYPGVFTLVSSYRDFIKSNMLD